MTVMKQITITVPTEMDNRTVFEHVLSAINNMETEGQIGDEGTWSGIILGEECDCSSCGGYEPESLEDIVESVIDNTCIECSQFYVDVGESACICDLLMDADDLGIAGYDEDDEGGNAFCEEWERQQKEILKDISKEDRERISNDLPNIPYGDDDEEDDEE
jgi:hypothetical protein